MARSVGRIEVTVDADTGRLKAQIVRGAKEAGEAGGEALEEGLSDIDGRELLAKIKEIRVRIERDLAGVEAEVEATLREGSLAEVSEEINAAVSDLEAEIDPTVAEGSLAGVVAEINSAVSDIDAEVDPKLKAGSLAGVTAEINSAVSNLDAEIDPNVSEAGLARVVLIINNAVSNITAEIHPSVDMAAKAKVDALLTANMTATGAKSGQNFGRSFGHGLSLQEKAIVGAVVFLAEPIAVALQGALSAATSIASSAFSGLAGAAGASLPIFASLAAGVGALVVGFQGMGDALGAVGEEFTAATAEGRAFNMGAEDIAAAMAQLGPAARDVVGAFAEMQPLFRDIRSMVQERLFAGLGDTLDELATHAIPNVGAALGLAADSLNRFFKNIADAANEVDFAGLFTEIQPAIDSIGDALVSVFSAIGPFFRAAAPAARELGASLAAAAESLRGMIEAGAQSGALTQFLLEGLDSLRDWWALLRNVADALFTVFQAGKSQGDSFVRSLADVVGRWDDWMESVEGQEALAEFFDTGRRAMEAMKPVLSGLRGFFDELITEGALERFEDLGQNLGELLPLLGQLLGLIGRLDIVNTLVELLNAVGDAIQPLIPELQELADNIGRAFGDAVDFVTPIIQGLADILGGLVHAFNELGDPIQNIVLLLGGLFLLRGPLGSFATSLGASRKAIDLLGTSAGLAKIAVGDMFRGFASGIKTADFSQLGKGLRDLGPALAASAKGVGAAAGIGLAGGIGIAFGAEMLSQADDMKGALTGALTIATSAFSAFAAGGPIAGIAAVGIGGILTLMQDAANRTREWAEDVEALKDAMGGLGEDMDKIAAIDTAVEQMQTDFKKATQQIADLGVPIAEWVRAAIEGTADVSDGLAMVLDAVGPVGREFGELVRSGKLTQDQLESLFVALSQNTDFMGAEMTAKVRALDEELRNQGITGDQLGEIYDALEDTLFNTDGAIQGLKDDAILTGDAMAGLGDDTDTAAGAQEGFSTAVRGSNDALGGFWAGATKAADGFQEITKVSDDGTQALKKLADRTDEVSRAMRVNRFGDFGRQLDALASTAEKAADSADALRTSLDLLAGGSAALQAAGDAVASSYDDAASALAEAKEGAEGATSSLVDLGSGGLENRQIFRDWAGTILDNVAAMKEQGKGAEEVSSVFGLQRQQMINMAEAFDTGALSAEEYVNQLLATPEEVETLLKTNASEVLTDVDDLGQEIVGLPTDAEVNVEVGGTAAEQLQNIQKYGRELAGTSVTFGVGMDDSEFQAQATIVGGWMGSFATTMVEGQTGLDTTEFDSKASAIDVSMADINNAEGTPFVGIDDHFTSEQEAISAALLELDNANVAPTVSLDDQTFTSQWSVIDAALNEADGKTTTTTTKVVIDDSQFLSEQEAIANALAELDTKVATPTVDPQTAEGDAKIASSQAAVDKLGASTASPRVTVPTYPSAKSNLDTLQDTLDTLGDSAAFPRVSIPNYPTAISNLRELQRAVDNLDSSSATPNVSVSGVGTALSNISSVANALSNLHDKTVTVHINTVGSVPDVGGATGGLVTNLFGATGGEAGLERAFFPDGGSSVLTAATHVPVGTLLVPLEKLGPMGGGVTIEKQVIINQDIKVLSAAADPAIVATQVMNRAAAAAN